MTRIRISTVTAGAVLAVTVVLANPVGAAAAEAPGAVTDTVELSGRLSVPAAASAQRLTYWSRGPRAPMQSTAAVYLPPGPAPAGGWPIVAYAHGSVGIADQCAFTENPRDYYLDTLYPRLLEAGYAVVISDYVGLGTPGTHPYLDGPSQARSVIDGVRAARSAFPELSSRWAVLGQSQGGQTALFTAHIAAADAPNSISVAPRRPVRRRIWSWRCPWPARGFPGCRCGAPPHISACCSPACGSPHPNSISTAT
nr:lipase family protein [Nocardia cyriacigeorgica]